LMYQQLNHIYHHELDVNFDHQVVDQTNDDSQQHLIHDRNQVLVLDCYKLVLNSIE
jgi:hypothetical protein